MPTPDALDLGALDISMETMHKLVHVDPEEWLREIPEIRKFYNIFGSRIPPLLVNELDELQKRLREVEEAPPTSNRRLLSWVEQIRSLTTPDKVHWCTGNFLRILLKKKKNKKIKIE